MKLDGIAAFVAVAEAGSISEAARRLHLAKSVVSERVSELERRLGARLIHRTTRKLSLTEDGTAFLERAGRIVRDVEAAASELAERRGTLVGPLRLSAPVTFARLHLGKPVFAFMARHPEIELTLDLNDRRVDAAAEGYDAVVRHGAINDSRLVVWKLAPSRRILVASRAYLKKHGTPKSLAELDAHRTLSYTNRGAADWTFADASGTDGTVVVRGAPRLRVNNGDLIHDAAVAGVGVAYLPTFICGPSLKAGKLMMLDIGFRSKPEFVYIAHPEGRQPSAKLRAFAETLREAFGSPPYWDRFSASGDTLRGR
jgi:DNA-binding transcriptional LysR family regulator